MEKQWNSINKKQNGLEQSEKKAALHSETNITNIDGTAQADAAWATARPPSTASVSSNGQRNLWRRCQSMAIVPPSGAQISIHITEGLEPRRQTLLG